MYIEVDWISIFEISSFSSCVNRSDSSSSLLTTKDAVIHRWLEDSQEYLIDDRNWDRETHLSFFFLVLIDVKKSDEPTRSCRWQWFDWSLSLNNKEKLQRILSMINHFVFLTPSRWYIEQRRDREGEEKRPINRFFSYQVTLDTLTCQWFSFVLDNLLQRKSETFSARS